MRVRHAGDCWKSVFEFEKKSNDDEDNSLTNLRNALPSLVAIMGKDPSKIFSEQQLQLIAQAIRHVEAGEDDKCKQICEANKEVRL
jgi:hypothetical protein